MKQIIAAMALALLATGTAHATEYGIEAQKRALECTGRTITEAFDGNFSRWALPDFVRGKHMRGGQYLDDRCQPPQ